MIQRRIINAFSRFSSPVKIFFDGTKTLALMALTVAWSSRVYAANFTQLYSVYVFLMRRLCYSLINFSCNTYKHLNINSCKDLDCPRTSSIWLSSIFPVHKIVVVAVNICLNTQSRGRENYPPLDGAGSGDGG